MGTTFIWGFRMPAADFEKERKEAEADLNFATENFGPNHPMVAARLEHLSNLLRREGKQLLEAANLEARAKAIRSKFDCEDFLSNSHRAETSETSAINDGTITADNAMSSYTIISKIGSGGMGAVFKAKHDKIEKLLAVKVLSADIVNSKPTRKRFEQELQAACNLSDPHLVSLYDFGVTNKGVPFLVMDFIDGTTLAEEIKSLGHISWKRALDIFIQLSEGVLHAHTKGILHRDLKPSNIMLTEINGGADFVKIVDFGLAKLMPSSGEAGKTMTSTTDVVGSPYYMSPEQCMGEQVDQRSDIYAIGCVMHEALTGQPPFSKGNTIKIIYQHLNSDRRSLLRRMRKFKFAPGLENIILRCLERKAKDRYQSVSELLSDLHKVKSGRMPGLLPFRISSQHMAVAGAAFFCVSLIAVCVGLGLHSRPKSLSQHAAAAPVLAGELPLVSASPVVRAAESARHSELPFVSAGTGPSSAALTARAALPASAALPAKLTTPTAFQNRYLSQSSQLPNTRRPIQSPPHLLKRPDLASPTNDIEDSSIPSSGSSLSSFFDPYISYRGKEYAIEISGNDRKTIKQGTYHLSKLKLSGNAALDLQGSPVVLIVRGSDPDESAVQVANNGGINTWRNPNNLQIINISTKPVLVSGNGQIWARIASTSPILTTGNGKVVSPGSAPFARSWGLEPDPPSPGSDESKSSLTYSRFSGDDSADHIAAFWNSLPYNENPNLISNAILERSDYRNEMAKRIQRFWFQPIGTKERGDYSVVKMLIDRRGTPLNVQSLSKTDFTAMDSSALAAIKSASPFAPPGEQVQFTLLFRDGRVQIH